MLSNIYSFLGGLCETFCILCGKKTVKLTDYQAFTKFTFSSNCLIFRYLQLKKNLKLHELFLLNYHIINQTHIAHVGGNTQGNPFCLLARIDI
jgi:hypothetical protein